MNTFPTIPNPYFHQQSFDPNNKYILIVKQQPQKARLCSFKEKVDRRPLDPPPIVELRQSNNTSFNDYHISANFFLHTTLADPNDHSDIHHIHGNQTIAGSVVQSLHKLKDTNNTEGAFFIFSDLSIRIEGIFVLRFTLFRIRGTEVERLCSIFSEPFRVYSPKSFPGMSESTELTKSFSDQGVRIRVRKEARSVTTPSMKRRRGLEQGTGHANEYFYSSSSSSPKEEDIRQSSSSSSNVMSMQNLLITDELPPILPEQSQQLFPSRILPRLSTSPPQTMEPSFITPSPPSSSTRVSNYYYYTSSPSSSDILPNPSFSEAQIQSQTQTPTQNQEQQHQHQGMSSTNFPGLKPYEHPYYQKD